MLLMLVSLVSVGCGSSSDDFVVVGNNGNNTNPPVPTGAVTFQFVTPQVDVQAQVPTGTQTLHFDFLNSQNDEVFETHVDFAPTVTVVGVPVTATRALVTALGANGVPLATILFNITVDPNQTSTAVPTGPGFVVTFDAVAASPDPMAVAVNATQQIQLSLAFSNGTILPGASAGGTASFNSGNTNVATVSADGLVTGVEQGTTTINVSYTLNGVTRNDSLTVNVAGGDDGGGTGNVSVNRLIASPTSVTLTNATTSTKITARFFPAGSTEGQVVTATGTLGNFTGGVNATNLTYVSASGNVTSNAAVNGTATLSLSYTPDGGSAVNTTVSIAVERAASTGGGGGGDTGTGRLELFQEHIYLPAGGSSAGALQGLYYPPNSTVGVVVTSFAATQISTTPAGTGANWTYNAGTGIFSGAGAAENNSVEWNVTYTPPGQAAVSDTVRVTAVNAASPFLQATHVEDVAFLTIVGDLLKLPAGSRYPLDLLEVRGDGTLNVVAPQVAAPGVTTPGQYLVTSSNAAVTYDTATGDLVFSGVGSDATITVTRNNTTVNGPNSVGTFTARTVDAATVNALVSNAELTLPAGNSGAVNAVLPYRSELIFTDGTRQDITPVTNVVAVPSLTANDIGGYFYGSVTITAAPSANTLTLDTNPATWLVNGATITNYNPNGSSQAITGQ
jgi:hypothetical protein